MFSRMATLSLLALTASFVSAPCAAQSTGANLARLRHAEGVRKIALQMRLEEQSLKLQSQAQRVEDAMRRRVLIVADGPTTARTATSRLSCGRWIYPSRSSTRWRTSTWPTTSASRSSPSDCS